MEIQHEIVHFDERAGQVVVRYFNDVGEITLAVDLPVDGGAFPSAEEVERIITHFTPKHVFARAAALKRPAAGADAIRAKVVARKPVEQPAAPKESGGDTPCRKLQLCDLIAILVAKDLVTEEDVVKALRADKA